MKDELASIAKGSGRVVSYPSLLGNEGFPRTWLLSVLKMEIVHGMWDLSSSTRDQARTPCCRSVES